MSFLVVLTLALIVLKLCGVISSWIWVLAPAAALLGPIVISAIVVTVLTNEKLKD